ncbi:MAG: metal-dependent transcriptional regulator [Desulfobacteraceae bacterium]
MSPQYQITQCIEKYLEVILRLEKLNGLVRVKDIAAELGLLKGSVSGNLKKLKTLRLVRNVPYSPIKLTPKGRRIAESIVTRNEILTRFLINVLHLDLEASKAAARRMGHSIDERVLERMRQYNYNKLTKKRISI